VFDNGNKIVHLLTFSGKESGALFAYRKNLNSIKRVVDTRSLVTRLYAYGKDGMTFSLINGGKEYVEDYTYSNEVRVSTLDCSNFTNPYQVLEFAKMRLAEYAKPRVSYHQRRVSVKQYTDKAREVCSDMPESVHPHMFRRTRATNLYQDGIASELVSAVRPSARIRSKC
jgi:phage minor structural protein